MERATASRRHTAPGAAAIAMLAGAIAGALLLRTTLVLPLAVAATLAPVARTAYPRLDRAADLSDEVRWRRG
jgi:hypothetical protein